ncbi:MAG: solute carrier family 23 protein [Eubacteriales bacterium]|nr:solute carrier family 23 protein [Eubacteriales bacterium]
MNLVYQVSDKPKFGKNLIYAFQQLLAIIAATILVPILSDSTGLILSQSAALIGAGVGTLVYIAFTRMKSPVFLGSSFAFIAPLATAVTYGYCGVILGSVFAGLVYVVIAIIIKKVGVNWINKLMPPVIIGPTVALIGLSLSGSAISNLQNTSSGDYNLLCILIGIVTFLVTIYVSVKGTKGMKLIPFVIGVLAGYVLAAVITLIGYYGFDSEMCKIIDFSIFQNITVAKNWLPNVTFVGAIKEIAGLDGKEVLVTGAGVASLFVAFAPVALVVFAEHVADHKNISSVIGKDLLKDPGLDNTLLGDGVGSIAGAVFGGCPNTTYGESVGCVAITGNASIWTIFTTAVMCILLAFVYPVMLFIESIPACVVGGICIALYGFIAVSGLRMFKNVDLDNSKNLFIVSSILVTGIGGLTLSFGKVQITSIACALILGIIVNLLLKPGKVNVEKIVTPVDDNQVTEETMFGTIMEEKTEDKK